MGSYRITWKHSAEKDLRRIHRSYIPHIIKAIEELSHNPFPSRHKKLYRAETTYRIRVGDYRIVYQVDKRENLITIYHIRHRRDVYRM